MTLSMLPWVAEALLVLAIVTGPLAFGAVEPWSLAVVQLLIFFAALACAITGRRPEADCGPLLLALSAIMVLAMMQTLNRGNISFPKVFLPYSVSEIEFQNALRLWISYTALVWCAPMVFSNPGAFRRMIAVIFATGAVVAIIGIIQCAHGNTAIYGLRPVRYLVSPYGPYYNRDNAATLMAVAGCLGAGLFVDTITNGRTLEHSNRVALCVLISCLWGLIVFGIVQSGSRAGFVSFVLSLFFVAALMFSFDSNRFRRRLVYLGLGMACAALFGIVMISPAWSRFRVSLIQHALTVRLSIYRSGISMLLDHPSFGSGLGSLRVTIPPYQESEISGIIEHIHSDYLELILQTGLFGFAMFAAGFLTSLFRALKYWRAQPAHLRGLIAGVLSAVIAFSLHMLVDFPLQIPANAFIFFVLMVLLSPRAKRANYLSGVPVRASIGVASLIMIILAARPAVAGWYVQKAHSVDAPEAIRLIDSAQLWNHSPALDHEKAKRQLQLAEDHPENRLEILRRALQSSGRAVDCEPFNRLFLYQHGAILWRLGRIEDAREYLGRESK